MRVLCKCGRNVLVDEVKADDGQVKLKFKFHRVGPALRSTAAKRRTSCVHSGQEVALPAPETKAPESETKEVAPEKS